MKRQIWIISSAVEPSRHNDWDVGAPPSLGKIIHESHIHASARFLGQPFRWFRVPPKILFLVLIFLKTLTFLGESLVPEPANEEQAGGVGGRDAYRGSWESQRRRHEGGREPDRLRGGGGLRWPPPATSPPPWRPTSSPSPRIGSHRGLQGSSKVPWGPAPGPNMDFNQCEASLVPNQHFASPMIDYFLLSRVPKKFRIELFALNICRWMMICTSPPWIIECHKK